MERTSGTKKGLRLMATAVFLMAALASTGCNTLMGPSSQTTDTAQNTTVVGNASGNNLRPSGNNLRP